MSVTLSNSQSGTDMLEMNLLRIKNQPKLRITCIAQGIGLVLHSALAPAPDKKGQTSLTWALDHQNWRPMPPRHFKIKMSSNSIELDLVSTWGPCSLPRANTSRVSENVSVLCWDI